MNKVFKGSDGISSKTWEDNRRGDLHPRVKLRTPHSQVAYQSLIPVAFRTLLELATFGNWVKMPKLPQLKTSTTSQ